MKAIIIDDETRVINTLTNLIHSIASDISIVATAQDIESGYKIVTKFSPDILFLDVQLPDGTGFDLLKKLRTITFKLIFITAHEEYAIKAIKCSALDYLLKPVDPDELYLAINKAKNLIKEEEEKLKIKTLIDNFENKQSLQHIVLHTAECLHIVKIEDIIRCQSDNNYTFFHLADKKRILVSKTIKEFSELLRTSGFLRVHQSHLINLAQVDKYVKSEGGYILMKDQSSVPISLSNKQQVLRALESM
jgi:two-component system, LytTR family, response regulator